MSETTTADDRTVRNHTNDSDDAIPTGDARHYDEERADDHGNDPTYAPLDARDHGSPCGACGAGTLRFVGGAPLPGWMGTPDGEREVYECEACGERGKLSQRDGRALSQQGACAPPEPTAAVDAAAEAKVDGGHVDPHHGESRAEYVANKAERPAGRR